MGILPTDAWDALRKEAAFLATYDYSTSLDILKGGGGTPAGGPEGAGGAPLEAAPGACYKVHNRTRESEKGFFSQSYIDIWKGGTLLKVHREVEKSERLVGAKKGHISEFNWATSQRIRYTLGKLWKKWLPVFCSVTFPDEYYEYRFTGEKTLKIWNAFQHRFRRQYPSRGAIWRREHKRRLSGQHVGEFFPHFHILVWGLGEDELRSWLRLAWFQVIGELNEKGIKVGTSADQVKTWREMKNYMSKYVSKKDADYFAEPGWGKWWGFMNKKYLPWVPAVRIELADNQAVQLLRYTKRACHSRRALSTRTLVTSNPDFWSERLGDILDIQLEKQ